MDNPGADFGSERAQQPMLYHGSQSGFKPDQREKLRQSQFAAQAAELESNKNNKPR